MSSTSLSPHIPDFDLITYYAERQESFFSRISPWTKLFSLAFIVIVITVTHNLPLLCAFYVLVVLLYAAAGMPLEKLAAWYLLPFIFVFSLVGILMWSEPGLPLFSLRVGGFVLTLTDNGLILAGTLLLKALISITFSLFFLMTTRYQHFAGMIARVFPSPLDQIFLMAYRFMFLTLAMTASLLKSVRSRGGGLLHSMRMQGRLFAGVFALIFIRSFEQGERVHRAMTARGFSGSYSAYSEVPRPALPEYAVLCTMGIAVIALAIVSWTGVPV
jgi:cobalt/nickel transport system permease protein